jgi:hypothetical protein
VQWIQQAKMEAKFSKHTEFVKPYVVPKYTVDAHPFLLRDASALMLTLVGLNSQNSQCHDSARYRPKAANSIMKSHWSKDDESFQLHSADTYASSERHPFVISMLRDPLARTVSFYNYFTLSRAIRANEKRQRDTAKNANGTVSGSSSVANDGLEQALHTKKNATAQDITARSNAEVGN